MKINKLNSEQEIQIENFEYVSKSGKSFKTNINKKLIQKTLNLLVTQECERVKEKCMKDEKLFLFKENLNKKDLNTTFFREFYTTYKGNPSMNGGHFNFYKFNLNDPEDRSIYESKQYLKVISQTLSCNLTRRWWGYGENQVAYIFVNENKETSEKFVPFLLDNKLIDFDKRIGKNKTKMSTGLLLYCIRSKDFKSISLFNQKLDLTAKEKAQIYEELSKEKETVAKLKKLI